ncbi:unnamed protein product (macronuclear) [Paramecium tetraurelia]|uniref:B box-type domain-containing protein n=1 Tax=Paramecium tetraurelia TaxID=5888 RepID=A0EFF5_PARTE|nr:uncharacterized protein GSPATT00026369001 [Paramecium tetraurelia]CAK94046.1 unnamed protein product [Paramecium tetraurelia]|eukprot:XP_001461419.1 hypothetical protein (macronuclear) [Paramecium tetraurelia strain d4-2]
MSRNPNLVCSREHHEQAPISGVCLNQQCQQNRAFCVACKVEFHKGHEADYMHFQAYPQWIATCLKPYQEFTPFQDTVLQTSNKLNDVLNLANNFRNQDISTMSIGQLEQYTKGLLTLKSSEAQLTSLINKVKADIGNLLLLLKPITGQQSASQQQQLIQSQSTSGIKQGGQSIQQVQPPVNAQPTQLNLTFSDKSKISPNIKIEKGGKQASGIGFVICDFVIPKDRDSIFAFKYNSGFSIALGLCYKERTVEQNYSEKLQKTGHGFYLITSASMSFSHSDEQVNNKSHKFKINPPDVIALRIKSSQKSLTWIINKEEVLVILQIMQTMTIDLSKELQPFIDICGVVDLVDA